MVWKHIGDLLLNALAQKVLELQQRGLTELRDTSAVVQPVPSEPKLVKRIRKSRSSTMESQTPSVATSTEPRQGTELSPKNSRKQKVKSTRTRGTEPSKVPAPSERDKGPCKIENCKGRAAYLNGLCGKHYQQYRRAIIDEEGRTIPPERRPEVLALLKASSRRGRKTRPTVETVRTVEPVPES